MALSDSARSLTTEDTQRMLAERAKDGDSFLVKVLRRAHMGAQPELIASFSGATLQHFSSPELWVPPLCGGGNFMLVGYHSTDLNKPIGGAIQFQIKAKEPRDVDASVIGKPDWRGPPDLEYPQKEAQRQQEDLGLYGVRSPSAPGPDVSATRSSQVWPRQAGGGSVHREEFPDAQAFANHQRQQAIFENERRALEEQRRSLDLEKHKSEIEAKQKSHDADMRALEAKLMGAIVQTKPTGPDSTMVMMQEIMKQGAEDRREQAKQAAEDRRATAALQAASDARFHAMMERMMERPKENPLDMVKTVVELIGKKGDNSDSSTKMMHTMMETMGTINGVAMDFVHAAADMQLGGQKEESPVAKGIESLVKGLGAMAKGAMARPPVQQYAPQQLPPAPQSYEQQARQVPPPPQPATPGSRAQPMETSIIDQMEQAIRTKHPVDKVAAALIAYIEDPSIVQALQEAGGDFEVVLQKRLGNWHNESPDNAAYLKALIAEVEKQFGAMGKLEEDAGADDSDGDEDQE